MRYILAPVHGEEFHEYPDWVIAPMDEARLKKILKVQELCAEHDLAAVDIREPEVIWGYEFEPEFPIGASSEMVSVSLHDVHYKALPKHDGSEYASAGIPIDDIERLATRPDGHVLVVGDFAWQEQTLLPNHIYAALKSQLLEERSKEIGASRLAPTPKTL